MYQAWHEAGAKALLATTIAWLALGTAGCGGAVRRCSPPERNQCVYGDLARPSSVRVQPAATKNPPVASSRQAVPEAPRQPATDQGPAPRPANSPRGLTADPVGQPTADLSRYLVQAGDRLEVLYTESWAVEGAYRLLPGDHVAIEYLHLIALEDGGAGTAGFRGHGLASGSPLDRQLMIPPDGKLALPYVGTVEAAGLTVGELADRLNARYQEFFIEPNVLVTLTETGARLEDLRAAIRTAGSRIVLVAPDGTINLPHVGFVNAAGLTMGELQLELSERYRRTATGWAVTVRLADLDPERADSAASDATSSAPGSDTLDEPVARVAPEILPVSDLSSGNWVR